MKVLNTLTGKVSETSEKRFANLPGHWIEAEAEKSASKPSPKTEQKRTAQKKS